MDRQTQSGTGGCFHSDSWKLGHIVKIIMPFIFHSYIVTITLAKRKERSESAAENTGMPLRTKDSPRAFMSILPHAVKAYLSWRLFLKFMMATVIVKPFCPMRLSSFSVTDQGSMCWNCDKWARSEVSQNCLMAPLWYDDSTNEALPDLLVTLHLLCDLDFSRWINLI